MPPPDRVPGTRQERPQRGSRLVRGIYGVGWRLGSRMPGWLVRALIRLASRLAQRRNGRHVRTLRENLHAATGEAPTPALVRAALASYLRTFAEVLALPGWTRAQVLERVRVVEEQSVRDAFEGTGAVVALPHSGNWDLAGAWACYAGMPVTTVAEQLGDAEFAAFLAFRERLGMEVLSHRDPAAIPALIGAIRRRRVVCLIADRDLGGSGVPVQWAGHPVTAPAGPALVARRTGARLLPAVCQYEGERMIVRVGPPVPHQPGRAGLIAMTQQVIDYFADAIARQPEDWHLMQPFFPSVSPSATEPTQPAGNGG